MKKLLCLALAALMLFGLAACAENGGETKAPETTLAPETTKAPETTEAPKPAPTPAEIEAAVAAALGEGYLATVDVSEEDLWSCPLGWLEDLSILDTWVAKQAAVPALNMDTVIVAKCKDAADADKVIGVYNDYLAQTVGYTRQYPFGAAKVQGARICKVDDLALFILAGAEADPEADEEAAAKLAAAEYEKIDAALEALFGYVPENLAVIPEDTGASGGLLGG